MTLRARLLLALGYLVALVLVAFGVPLAANMSERVTDEVRSGARAQADVLAAGVAGLVEPANPARLAALAGSVGRAARARVVILDRRGRIVADSAGPQSLGADFSRRPEVAATLAGRRAQDERASATLHQDILATAAPVIRGRRVIGAVRLTQSVDAVNRAVRRTIAGVVAAALAALLGALVVAYLLARGITRPIERLGAAADRIALGQVDARAQEDEGSSEQRSLAGSFNLMTDRLARAANAQIEFVADASHQLRTPLTGLRLRLEEARASGDRTAAAAHLDAGIAELDRMSATIDELLLLSRTGGRDAPGEQVDLGEAATDACRRWRATAGARDIVLSAVPGEGGAVWCARPDLDRALDAVLDNALLYTPCGGRVTVRASEGHIEVLDDGPGLSAGEEAEVFARFRRGTAGKGTPGSGLGLPIARELMRVWGGGARLDNRPEGGARATLTLPPFTGPLPTDP